MLAVVNLFFYYITTCTKCYMLTVLHLKERILCQRRNFQYCNFDVKISMYAIISMRTLAMPFVSQNHTWIKLVIYICRR